MKWIVLVFLLISCQDNTEEEMKLFQISLSGDSIALEVDNKFTEESIVKAIDGVGHYAFPAITEINGRIYVAYRSGLTHVDTGNIKMKYSDDDGETWSGEIFLYDGGNIKDNFPEMFPDDSYTIDVRGPNLINLRNGTVLLTTGNTIRDVNLNTTNRVGTNVLFGYSGNVLNTTILNESYAEGLFDYGTPILNNGIIYKSGYTVVNDLHTVQLWKSTDMGYNFIFVSDIVSGANECAISMVENKITARYRKQGVGIATGRSESNDFGLNWTVKPDTISSLDGLCSSYLGNNLVVYVGRNRDPLGVDVFIDLQVINWETGILESSLIIWDENRNTPEQGYSAIIKYRDRYFLTYYIPDDGINWSNKTGVNFRQLIYNSNTNQFSFT